MENFPKNNLPRHIGIIMDGNGRWATQHGLPRQMGHRQGAKVFSQIAQYCREIGIPYLTVYAFSTENWNRPQTEINAIMDLLRDYLKEAQKNSKEDVRTCFLGDKSRLDLDLQEKIHQIEHLSRNNTAITVNIALNYGGRDEIVCAAKKIAEFVKNGKISVEEIDETLFSQYLYTKDQPDPDLIIRPSGECRISNFLIWQSAYAELVFMDILWPDFKPKDLDAAIKEFLGRNRRFGRI